MLISLSYTERRSCKPFPSEGKRECGGHRGRWACHAAAPSPRPSPLRGGEGVRWRSGFRNGKPLIVGGLAPPTARTGRRRFPLSPSDGERAGVRGAAGSFGLSSTKKCARGWGDDPSLHFTRRRP